MKWKKNTNKEGKWVSFELTTNKNKKELFLYRKSLVGGDENWILCVYDNSKRAEKHGLIHANQISGHCEFINIHTKKVLWNWKGIIYTNTTTY